MGLITLSVEIYSTRLKNDSPPFSALQPPLMKTYRLNTQKQRQAEVLVTVESMQIAAMSTFSISFRKFYEY